ncbi:MAG: L-serine ammonia-lyase [Desulfovibrio sp.]|nr:L-serine ammonia-lyase [Desulfovibrio sp.]
MAHPYLLHASQLKRPPIETALFDFFKMGPGPSSSHTIGPMKAGADFIERLKAQSFGSQHPAKIEVTLLGSLSATGKGHGTDVAVLAGLLGNSPDSCPPTLLPSLAAEKDADHTIHIGSKKVHIALNDILFGPVNHDCPYNNTLRIKAIDKRGSTLLEMEYYSVGGGFIQWKGYTEPEHGKPVHPYGTMRELFGCLHETGLSLHELILENEMAITGMGRPAIYEQLDAIMDGMYQSVERGLTASGKLPGTLGVWRKAGELWDRAKAHSMPIGKGMGLLNAYAFAVAEENAAGGVIVTAPTCGAAGVMPALLYAMRHDLNVGERALREGILASAAIGMIAKHNAGIAGAEVGCQGEIGVASSMAAAMLAHARGYSAKIVENAAEIALEHHLGLTCDPVGGYVQIPCIERNAMGAVKAGNAVLLATNKDDAKHLVSLDAAIMAMGEIGRDMNVKFKETSKGGLAVSMVEC